MAPKVVINIDSDSPVNIEVNVSGQSEPANSKGVTGGKGYSKAKSANVGSSTTSASVDPASSAASAPTGPNLVSTPGNPKAESMGEGDWERVEPADQLGSPVPPSHSPDSPVPLSDSLPMAAPIAGPPESESESSTTPLLEREFVATKSGRAFHLRTCGMLKNKVGNKLHLGLKCCPVCTGPRPLRNEWRFALCHENPRKMHLMAADGSTHCRMNSIDAVLTPCKQCIHG